MKRSAPLRRRGPLPRSASLERTTWMRRKRAKPRRNERERDLEYLADVHLVRCWAAESVPGHRCQGDIEADHAGARAMGRKADDLSCIALCSFAHRQRTDFSGPFRAYDQPRMRVWLAEGIAYTQSAVAVIRSRRRAA